MFLVQLLDIRQVFVICIKNCLVFTLQIDKVDFVTVLNNHNLANFVLKCNKPYLKESVLDGKEIGIHIKCHHKH